MTALAITGLLVAPVLFLILCGGAAKSHPALRLQAARLGASALFPPIALGIWSLILSLRLIVLVDEQIDWLPLLTTGMLALGAYYGGLIVLLCGYVYQVRQAAAAPEDSAGLSWGEAKEMSLEFCTWTLFLVSLALPPLVIPLALGIAFKYRYLRWRSALVVLSAMAVCALGLALVTSATPLYARTLQLGPFPGWLIDGFRVIPFLHLGLMLAWFSGLLDERAYYQPGESVENA